MSAVVKIEPTHEIGTDTDPVVVIGCGPVGCRIAEELLRHAPNLRIVQYGAEAIEPYNRVRLSSFLAGEINYAALINPPPAIQPDRIERRLGCAVLRIDRDRHRVHDAFGRQQPYSRLVLAIGSSPHVPHIANVQAAGVYTFRDFNDAQQLFARRMRSRRTVVLGAGLLGLEAARAMRRFNTDVVVIEHAPRALPRLLDDQGSIMLTEHLQTLGIRTVLGVSVRAIEGAGRVSGVRLSDGQLIECDTVIVATGIRPNIDLARNAGISVGRGVRVDDSLRTSDPDVFAVGECVEHRETLYGLVGPGLEQAAVAAAVMSGQRATYSGSTLATKLKVVGLPVFAVGRTTAEEIARDAQEVVYRSDGGYRKLVIERGRLIGAVSIKDAPEMGRLQEAVTYRRRVWFWQRWRFARAGLLWPPAESQSVSQWPATVTVCQCTGVTRGQLTTAMSAGCRTPQALAERTGASTVCGSCKPLLAELTGAVKEPVQGARWLWGTALFAALAALLFVVTPAVPFSNSLANGNDWDILWRDNFYRQLSGFSLLALAAAAAVLSLRKRIGKFTVGKFASWRVAHGLIGAAALAVLAVHTGARLGSNLNFFLIASFLALVALGGIAAGITAVEHRYAVVKAKRRWQWAHIAFVWPLPVLLGWHVLKSYYF